MRYKAEKPVLLPVYFTEEPDEEFSRQLVDLHRLFDDEAEILAPAPLNSPVPDSVDA